MRQRVNGGGRQQRAIGHDGPGGAGGTAVGCFPNAAADIAQVGDDTAVGGRRRIGHDGIDASFGASVVITAGTTRHVLGLWAKGSEACGAHGLGAVGTPDCEVLDHALASSRHPALDRTILFGSLTRPGGRVAARGIGQPVVPEFFFADETLGIGGSMAESELSRTDFPEEPIAVAVRIGVFLPPVLALPNEGSFGIVAEMFKMPFSSAVPWMVATMPAEPALMTIVTPSPGFQLPPLKTSSRPAGS
jgi:hypothetical protein